MSGGPQRTCVACREHDAPDAMVRLVRHPVTGAIVPDLAGKLPGRGAWVHPRAACVADLVKRRGKLGRALQGPVDASTLPDVLREALVRAASDGISMAAASGSLLGGHDRLVQGLHSGAIRMVIVASDVSPRTLASLERAATEAVEGTDEPRAIFVTLPLTRDELGQRTGRGSRAALGVRSTRGSAFLRRQLRRLRDLG